MEHFQICFIWNKFNTVKQKFGKKEHCTKLSLNIIVAL